MIKSIQAATFIVFFSLALIFSLPLSCYAITPAGASIESHAELSFENGSVITDTIVTTVEQMYGITIEPTALFGKDSAGSTHYFPHAITNLGNGTDNIRFHFVTIEGDTWSYALIKDGGNGIHESYEITPESNPMQLSEEGQLCFFIAVTIPMGEVLGASREAMLVATGEGQDGSYYTGANGLIYGGPDTAEVSDLLTVEGNVNPMIHREDNTNKIYLTWNGGTAEVLYIEGTFDATFANPITESTTAESPFYCSTEAKDGKTRYYKIRLLGRATEEVILGKFDIVANVGINELSCPLVPYGNDPGAIVGTQVTGGYPSSNSDIFKRYVPSTGQYQTAWLCANYPSDPSKNGKWFTGSVTADVKAGTDEGWTIQVLTSHPSTCVTIVGEVSRVNRTNNIAVGVNFVGTCFPISVTMESSNLKGSGFTGGYPSSSSDMFKLLNTSTGQFDILWLCENYATKPSYNGRWLKGSALNGSTIKLTPGKGYWIQVLSGHSPFTWNYTKPY